MTVSTTLNPYHIAGPIHNPAHFYGRDEQLRRVLEHTWQHHQSTNLVGEACSGKTSLLFRMLDPNVRARYVPEDRQSIYVYLNPELCKDRETFYRIALQGVEKECPDLLHLGQTDPLTEEEVQVYLQALLPRHLVLLVDNFEQMCDYEHFDRSFFGFLRGLGTHTDFYVPMVVASRKHIHDLCPSHVLESGFYNIFTEVYLGAFTEDEYDEFIQQTSFRSGAPILEVREQILQLAGYYPYLVQMACSHVYDLWRRQGRLRPEDMTLIRREFHRDAMVHFQRVWGRHLSTQEKHVLGLLAQDKPVSAEFIVGDLETKGYVANGAIVSQCFADFILSQLNVSRPGNAVASRAQPKEQGIRIDQASGEIYIDGIKLEKQLSPLQHSLLTHLWLHKGSICKKDDLALIGWNTANGVTDEALAQQVARLRALLGGGRRYIVTVNRWGYKMVDAPEQAESDPRKNGELAGASHSAPAQLGPDET